ncbi:FG-GAP-like repeat-containing protein [Luteitalea sp.]|uniref:FG-GAP-like repeat-containing protein n=1 Tax=Luteitalea sp. TaxID=2004800 RepID=UPI0025C435CF|nr:FG-GAP-like repeat-containing protein [Luteitalea sp.]
MTRTFSVLAVVVSLGVVLAAQTAPSPRDVRERAWQANNLGVAYLEQFNHEKAATQFEAALAIDGSFTPARVNLAIARLYEPDLPAALKAATAAAATPAAPPHADFVLGLIARSENREADAVAAFRRVLETDPDDVASLVNLGQLLLQRREYAEAVPVFSKAVDLEPYNVSALYNLAVAQTRAGQRELGAATTAKFQALRETGYGTTYSNTYMEQGRYAEAILSTGGEPDLVPPARPLTYSTTPLTFAGSAVSALAAADVDGDGRSDYLTVGPLGVDAYLNAGTTPQRVRPAPWPVPAALGTRGVVVADVDNDGKADLLLHGRGGIALWHQKSGTTLDFEDVTAASGIVTSLDVRTAALVDLDHDGDADVVLGGASRDAGDAAPLAVWRNNGDGTFADISATALPGQTPMVARAMVPTDVDLRRDIDLIVLGDDGRVRLWRNMRDASFREVSTSVGLDALPAAAALAVGDATKDGFPDIAVSAKTGESVLAVGASNNRFNIRPFAALPAAAHAAQMVDADNDGLLDVVTLQADGVRVIRQVAGGFEDVSTRAGLATAPGVTAGAEGGALLLLDTDASGGMDAVMLRAGTATLHLASGAGWPSIRVRLTAQVSNRSGLGAKVEMRAGSLWQKLETSASSPSSAPADILFGLGTRASVDVVRVLWPAGIVQAEPISADTLKANALDVVELDRKPSSCPYLYTWNGDRFEFVTDFLGGGEMGYQVAPGVFNTPDPEEFVRIRGDQLRPTDGRYELRITNELEETLFLDHLSLVAVDHPEGMDVFPREGLVSAPDAGLRLEALRNRRAATRVTDAAGHDATRVAARTDRAFVDGLPLLPVRGYAKPHAMTIDLGADTPARGAVLLLTGWTDYAFSSDNIAASQAGHALQPPALQVRDARGVWQTVIAEIGVPVGRPQTIVVDLTDRFLSASREVRIATSMRVYWDQVEVATRDTRATPIVTRVDATTADLRWRGFSEMVSTQEPLTFDYSRVLATSPWKQMPGRYTREGDVRSLLTSVDDAFVVSRPGDEVALSFDASALPALRDGWTRTFLLHGDGFSKEMDINSASPDQAWPLPSRTSRGARPGMSTPASPLDEPEWFTRYNTRVVGRQVPRLAGLPQ